MFYAMRTYLRLILCCRLVLPNFCDAAEEQSIKPMLLTGFKRSLQGVLTP